MPSYHKYMHNYTPFLCVYVTGRMTPPIPPPPTSGAVVWCGGMVVVNHYYSIRVVWTNIKLTWLYVGAVRVQLEDKAYLIVLWWWCTVDSAWKDGRKERGKERRKEEGGKGRGQEGRMKKRSLPPRFSWGGFGRDTIGGREERTVGPWPRNIYKYIDHRSIDWLLYSMLSALLSFLCLFPKLRSVAQLAQRDARGCTGRNAPKS